MLGRRLLLLVAVLLATGAIAAALTPRDLRGPTTATTPTATTATTPSSATGGTSAGGQVNRTVSALAAKPAEVRARVGDLLHLEVRLAAPGEVELVGLSRFASGDDTTPAVFDFLPSVMGEFPIRLLDGGRDVGKLVVGPA